MNYEILVILNDHLTSRILVSLESLYGICCPFLRESASALMTLPSALKLHDKVIIPTG